MAKPRNAATEVYGFAVYLTSFVVMFVILVWAYVPESGLHAMGVYYFPSKYWAIAAPMFLLFSFMMVPVVYVGVNFRTAVAFHAPNAYTPPETYTATDRDRHLRAQQLGSVPPIYDLPTALVNRAMFAD